MLYETLIEGGKHWSLTVRGGTRLRLIDRQGGANVGMLFYNPQNTLERYNAPDTLKCQHTFKLTKGHCLYSDMGRIFCSIVEDTLGWHDTACGTSTRASPFPISPSLTEKSGLTPAPLPFKVTTNIAWM